MACLTQKCAKVLHAFHDLTEQNGYAPTLREVSAAVRVSPSGAGYHAANLERMGYITRGSGQRGTALTEKGRAALGEKSGTMKRPVLRIDLETGESVRFDSAADAADATYCSTSTVREHANGKRKGDLDGRWRFNWITEETA